MYVGIGSLLFGRDLPRKIRLDWSSIEAQCSYVSCKDCSVQSISLLKEFSDVFGKPVGIIKNFKAELVLIDNAAPRFFKAWLIAFALREKGNQELQKMKEAGVIERVEHSESASSLVVVLKSDRRVGITGDFKRTVNPQLCVTQFPLALAKDLFESVLGGIAFYKLDGSDDFHQ